MTAAEALQEHGLTGEALLGLSRKAADDALRRHGAFLDHDRFEELVSYLAEVGLRQAVRYEPGHGISIVTYVYRIQRRRYVDWLRLTRGDTRRERPSRIPASRIYSLDELRDGSYWEAGYDEVDERLSAV